MTREFLCVIHVADAPERQPDERTKQCCARCGAILRLDYGEYPEGAFIETAPTYQVMTLGASQPTCEVP